MIVNQNSTIAQPLRRGIQLCCLSVLILFFSTVAYSLPPTPPPGPYQVFCHNIAMNGTTLSAQCIDFFGNFRATILNDAASCTGDFTDVNGQKHRQLIQDVDGSLRCVVSMGHVGGDHATDFDIISRPVDRVQNGLKTRMWRIDRPQVWSSKNDGAVDYPMITFKPGDKISFGGGGCVQTGGFGRTWKSYFHPSGDNAEQYYAGTVFIKHLTGGTFQRLGGLANKMLGPLPNDPNVKADYILRLGYQDNQMDDNGYWNHDDGNNDQCKGVGPAFVDVTIISGGAVSGPLLSPHSKPFDLVWDMNNEDENGLAVNPQWNFSLENHGEQPHLKFLCGAAFSSSFGWNYTIDEGKLAQICTSMPVNFDVDPRGAVCAGDPVPGHMNFGIATYQGQITWGEWSNLWPNDNDWSFELAPDNDAGLAGNGDDPGPAATMHLEFDFGDVDLNMPFWADLVMPPFIGMPMPEIGSIFAGPDGNGLEGVVIGEIGLDGVHGGNVESHPVFAIAARLTQSTTSAAPNRVAEKWAFFLRNFGDEGGCSSQTWHWESPTGDFFIPLPWPQGATDVRAADTDVAAWQDAPSPVNVEKSENHTTLIHVRAPQGVDEFGVGGTVTLSYTVPGGLKKKSAKASAQPRKRIVAKPETEEKDLSAQIADPAVKARYTAAVQALAPTARPRPKTKVAVIVPGTVTVRRHVPGAASRGQLLRARAVPNVAKQKRDLEMFKILQTYQKDLQIEVPSTLPPVLKVTAQEAKSK